MRLLLVEDDPQQASFLVQGLKHAGFAVDHVDQGPLGLDYGLRDCYDVIVMDIMLPGGMNGLEVIEALRGKGVKTPILVLSARQSVDDRVMGLQKGGDDYLIKPFAFTELLARLRALLRRRGLEDTTTTLTVGDLTLDLLSREATRGEHVVQLQTKEFELLEYMMRNKGRIVSKTMIMEHVWNFNFDPQTNIVEVRMSKLREKVDRPFDRRLIHTVRGAGYVIKET